MLPPLRKKVAGLNLGDGPFCGVMWVFWFPPVKERVYLQAEMNPNHQVHVGLLTNSFVVLILNSFIAPKVIVIWE